MRKRTRVIVVVTVALISLIALAGVTSLLAGDGFLVGAISGGVGLVSGILILLATWLAFTWVMKGK